MARIDPNLVEQARRLYADGLGPEEIGPKVGKTARTVRYWAERYGWKQGRAPEALLEEKIEAILEKAEPTTEELHRLDVYRRNLEGLRKGRKQRKERAESARNDRGDRPGFFDYQRRFLEDESLFRFALKARQIGFSWLIAWEALERAMRLGRDQTFASASFRQTSQIRKYVRQHARNYFGLKLKGTEVVRLPNDAEIHFLAANPATAQGFSGDVYFDEFFWMPRAREMFENAAAIATLGDYRITITSTPSVVSHYGYELWDDTRSELNISRHVYTIVDAVEGGNHLVRLDKILGLYPPEALRRLFMCEFLDDAGSVFTFDEVMACVRDDPGLFERTDGETVWGGMDISRQRDDTSIQLLAVDQTHGAPLFTWRHRELWQRIPLPEQEVRARHVMEEWQPERFCIDATTIGWHLAEAMQGEFDGVELVTFRPKTKAELVTNAQRIVQERRLRLPFDQRLIDSFLAIKRKSLETDVGYEADSNSSIGHADDFWALALALYGARGAGDDEAFILI